MKSSVLNRRKWEQTDTGFELYICIYRVKLFEKKQQYDIIIQIQNIDKRGKYIGAVLKIYS